MLSARWGSMPRSDREDDADRTDGPAAGATAAAGCALRASGPEVCRCGAATTVPLRERGRRRVLPSALLPDACLWAAPGSMLLPDTDATTPTPSLPPLRCFRALRLGVSPLRRGGSPADVVLWPLTGALPTVCAGVGSRGAASSSAATLLIDGLRIEPWLWGRNTVELGVRDGAREGTTPAAEPSSLDTARCAGTTGGQAACSHRGSARAGAGA